MSETPRVPAVEFQCDRSRMTEEEQEDLVDVIDMVLAWGGQVVRLDEPKELMPWELGIE